MALFSKQKFIELEEKYSNGVDITQEGLSFNLKICKIEPYPSRILEYDWEVTLQDNHKFKAHMGPHLPFSTEKTRYAWILKKLDHHSPLEDNRTLARLIDQEIQNVLEQYLLP